MSPFNARPAQTPTTGSIIRVVRKWRVYPQVPLTEICLKVFDPFKVLKQTKTIRLLVAPDTREAGSLTKRANGVLPVPASTVSVALQHIAAWEADHGETGFVKSVGEVDTQTIWSILEGWREQTDQIEVKISVPGALCELLAGDHIAARPNIPWR